MCHHPSIVHLSRGVKDDCLHHLLAIWHSPAGPSAWKIIESFMNEIIIRVEVKHSFIYLKRNQINRLLFSSLFWIGESLEPASPTIWCRIPSKRIQSRIRTWIPTYTQLWDVNSVAWFATTQASSWPWQKAPNRPSPSANINSKTGDGIAPPRTFIADAISSERSSIEVKRNNNENIFFFFFFNLICVGNKK